MRYRSASSSLSTWPRQVLEVDVAESVHRSIGEVLELLVAEFPDITISKIRFLESRGLIRPERTPSGYRRFYQQDIDRLRWILLQQREHYLPLDVIKGRLDQGKAIAANSSVPLALSLFSQEHGADDESTNRNGMQSWLAQAPEATSGHPDAAMVGAPASAMTSHSDALDTASDLDQSHTSFSNPILGTNSHPRERATSGVGSSTDHNGPVNAGNGVEFSLQRVTAPSSSLEAIIARGIPEAKGAGGDNAARPSVADYSSKLPESDESVVEAGSGNDVIVGERHGSSNGISGAGATPDGQVQSRQSAGDVMPSRSGPKRTANRGKARRAKVSQASASPSSSKPVANSDTKSSSSSVARGVSDSKAKGSYESVVVNGLQSGQIESGKSFSPSELAGAAGISPEVVAELLDFGLIEAHSIAGETVFDEAALVVARIAGAFRRFGIESRHLRSFKHSAEREATLFGQVVTPLLRQRNPTSRAKALEDLGELSDLGAELRQCFVLAALKDLTGR